MTAKLTQELQKALREAGEHSVEFLEPETGAIYVLIAKELVITPGDVSSIQRGIDQLNAGQGRPIHESKTDLARQLGFYQPQ